MQGLMAALLWPVVYLLQLFLSTPCKGSWQLLWPLVEPLAVLVELHAAQPPAALGQLPSELLPKTQARKICTVDHKYGVSFEGSLWVCVSRMYKLGKLQNTFHSKLWTQGVLALE